MGSRGLAVMSVGFMVIMFSPLATPNRTISLPLLLVGLAVVALGWYDRRVESKTGSNKKR